MSSLVILAGGKGTRLGELTKDTPKPMMDIFGKPFLYWLIKHYVSQGFTDIVVSTGYKAEVIEQYPWPWKLGFYQDVPGLIDAGYWYYPGSITTNGDTFIPETLPKEEGPWIITDHGVDAGAQAPGVGKIRVFEGFEFYDIGTPDGLSDFKEYFATHPLYLSELIKGIP